MKVDKGLEKTLELWKEEFQSQTPPHLKPNWLDLRGRIPETINVSFFDEIGLLAWKLSPALAMVTLLAFYGTWQLHLNFESDLAQMVLTSSDYLDWISGVV